MRSMASWANGVFGGGLSIPPLVTSPEAAFSVVPVDISFGWMSPSADRSRSHSDQNAGQSARLWLCFTNPKEETKL